MRVACVLAAGCSLAFVFSLPSAWPAPCCLHTLMIHLLADGLVAFASVSPFCVLLVAVCVCMYVCRLPDGLNVTACSHAPAEASLGRGDETRPREAEAASAEPYQAHDIYLMYM